MNPALRVAATGMQAQQTKVESIAHNMANVNTTAFKKSQMQFETLLYQRLQGSRISSVPGTETVPAIEIGRGVRATANAKVFSQGVLQQTGRELDVAVNGEGFFQVQLPDGSLAYTRDGSFSRSSEGLLVTSQGYPVAPHISIPADVTQVGISSDGTLSGVIPGVVTPVDLGRLELSRFINPAGLSSYGQNLYTETVASGPAQIGFAQEEGFGIIHQGSLESSNVEIVTEMVDMIAAQRAFEINSRVIEAGDRMMEQTSGMVR